MKEIILGICFIVAICLIYFYVFRNVLKNMTFSEKKQFFKNIDKETL